MPLLRYALALLICSAVSVVAFAQKPDDAHFPTDDEVLLVLTQTERAANEYKPLSCRSTIDTGGYQSAGRNRREQPTKPSLTSRLVRA